MSAWGQEDTKEAFKKMRQSGKPNDGLPSLPWARLAPPSAAGPSGERYEHLEDILANAGMSQKRRLVRILEDITVKLATNRLPSTFRWMLNTQAVFLKKNSDALPKEFDDEEWHEDLHLADVPEDLVGDMPDEEESWAMEVDTVAPPGLDHKPKVRPLQIGEFMRRWVSKRLLKLNSSENSCVMTASRQLGVGTSGGAEALAIFHQLLFDEWVDGHLSVPLARIKIDEKNCFGMLEWDAVRRSVSEAFGDVMEACECLHG
jgi:hypothetical protein